MSQFHPNEDDEADDRANMDAGFWLRVKWVNLLRAALQPFAEGCATEADRRNAQHVLENTKEWLSSR